MLGDALVVLGRDLSGNPLTLSHQHSLTQVPLICRLGPLHPFMPAITKPDLKVPDSEEMVRS